MKVSMYVGSMNKCVIHIVLSLHIGAQRFKVHSNSGSVVCHISHGTRLRPSCKLCNACCCSLMEVILRICAAKCWRHMFAVW